MTPSPTPSAQESALPAPCPFCGADGRDSEANVTNSMTPGEMRYAWYCTACNAEGPMHYSAADALAAWNRRATPPIQQGVVEALEKIANMPGATDEWDAVEKYKACRELALASLRATSGENGNG